PSYVQNRAFVAKLNAGGTALGYSTYLSGSFVFGKGSVGYGIAVGGAGNAYVTGETDLTDFPIRNPVQSASGGGGDAFVTELNAAGSALVSSTYLGGGGFDAGRGIAVDTAGNAYIVGSTASTNFPTTATALQQTNRGGDDAFIALINSNTSPSFAVSGFPSPITAGVAATSPSPALDSTGHPATNYTATVHFSSSDPQAVLPADYTFTTADAGMHTFVANLKTAGNQTIYVTD